jgi:phosphoserine aminotransferase
MNTRVYNFNPGPAILPSEVLARVEADVLDYGNSGIGVLELSHRGALFKDIFSSAEANLRELVNSPFF